MTVDLEGTVKLDVTLGAPDGDTLVINPEIGRQIDLWKQQAELNLYLDREQFIQASDNYREVLIDQQNDFEKGAIRIKNSLNKDLDYPDRVKLFRKLDNIFLKIL